MRLHFFTDVRNLRTTEITHDTIAVEWDAVDGPCFITYNVAILTAYGNLIDSFVVRVNQFTFMDLMSNTSYMVTVSAANQHGDGRTTSINVTTGLETLSTGMYVHTYICTHILFVCNV